MAVRKGDRYQKHLFPPSIEEYVGKDDPVRAYDAFIDALSFDELEIKGRKANVGNSNYDPKTMLKILVYAYSYGWQSSRKIERALHHNLSFIWLSGGLRPDSRTIRRFRKSNHKALRKTLKQCVRLCIKLDLIDGNVLFLDGSKFRGNASINRTYTKKGSEKRLAKIDKKIEKLLTEIDEIDEQEKESSVSKLEEELQNQAALRLKVKSILDEMNNKNVNKMNTTDKDAINFKGRQGIHAGYNPQVVTDEKNGIVANADVVAESNDLNQFSQQIQQANENLGKKCDVACSDSGYSNVDNLKDSVDEGITVIVPSQKQASHKKDKEEPFAKDKFKYDEDNNQYICPEGHVLRYSHYSKKKNYYLYRMKTPSDCMNCKHWGVCTKSNRGRGINRLKNEECKEYLASLYESEYGQSIYKKRKSKVELQFGHIKRNLNRGAFSVRSLKSVKGEMAIFANCFNVARMITLLGGVEKMVKTLSNCNAT